MRQKLVSPILVILVSSVIIAMSSKGTSSGPESPLSPPLGLSQLFARQILLSLLRIVYSHYGVSSSEATPSVYTVSIRPPGIWKYPLTHSGTTLKLSQTRRI